MLKVGPRHQIAFSVFPAARAQPIGGSQRPLVWTEARPSVLNSDSCFLRSRMSSPQSQRTSRTPSLFASRAVPLAKYFHAGVRSASGFRTDELWVHPPPT